MDRPDRPFRPARIGGATSAISAVGRNAGPMRATDRRTRRTRASSRQPLRGLLLEKGYDAITPSPDVRRSTFHLHFRGKHDPVRRSFERPHEESLSRLKADPRSERGGPAFPGPLLEHVEAHRRACRASAGTRARPIVAAPMRRLLPDLCSQHMRGQRAADDLPRVLAARALAGSLDALILGWVEGAVAVPAERIGTLAFRFATRGLGGDCGGDPAPPRSPKPEVGS